MSPFFVTTVQHAAPAIDLAPPASNRLKAEITPVIDPRNHKTDLIKMAGNHNLRSVSLSGLFSD
jgi:hypothetical protein